MRLRAQAATRRLRRTITVAGAALLAALGLAVASGAQAVPAVAAASSCTAAYSVANDWGSGFTASLTITNNGTAPVTGWTVTYSYAGSQTLASGWNGTWTQSGKAVTVTSASYNGSLGAGAATTAGANFNYSGANAAPATVSCTPAGSTTPPPGSISATPSSLNVTQGSTGTFTLALSQAPAANETVSVAASGNTGLTASAASLTFTPSNYSTPQTVTVTANAAGTGTTTFTASGSGYTAATVTATEVAPQTGSAPQLHVSGNKLVNASGNPVVLHGVDRSGTEYMCVQGSGIFDGPSDQASITAIKSWGPVNAVRVPLNEACWNAESYVGSPRGRHLHQRDQELRQPVERQRHRRHPRPALDGRDLHRPVVRLLVGRGHLPEADAGRRGGDPVLDVGGGHLQG
jgi:endoglucanase